MWEDDGCSEDGEQVAGKQGCDTAPELDQNMLGRRPLGRQNKRPLFLCYFNDFCSSVLAPTRFEILGIKFRKITFFFLSLGIHKKLLVNDQMEIKWLVKLFSYIFSPFSHTITILKEKSGLEKIIWKTTIFQLRYR